MRAFAKSLGVNHGILSTILSTKRPLTPQLVQKLGLALKMNKNELDMFISALPNLRATEIRKRREIKELNQLTVDVFNVVSDWYHDAILELSRVKGFNATPGFISKRLGITVSEARAAIERLERVGLIEINADGKWVETLGDNTTAVDVDLTNSALRGLQKQVLQRSLHALENVPKVHRDHTCTTMAIRTRDLPEAKKRIKRFRHELMSFLQRDSGPFDEVFQLAVSLYPLTKMESKVRRSQT
jgi:uncharacterized protein (TIGR02147 family)